MKKSRLFLVFGSLIFIGVLKAQTYSAKGFTLTPQFGITKPIFLYGSKDFENNNSGFADVGGIVGLNAEKHIKVFKSKFFTGRNDFQYCDLGITSSFWYQKDDFDQNQFLNGLRVYTSNFGYRMIDHSGWNIVSIMSGVYVNTYTNIINPKKFYSQGKILIGLSKTNSYSFTLVDNNNKKTIFLPFTSYDVAISTSLNFFYKINEKIRLGCSIDGYISTFSNSNVYNINNGVVGDKFELFVPIRTINFGFLVSYSFTSSDEHK